VIVTVVLLKVASMNAMPEETLFFFDFDVFAIVLKPLMKSFGVGCRQSLGQADRKTLIF